MSRGKKATSPYLWIHSVSSAAITKFSELPSIRAEQLEGVIAGYSTLLKKVAVSNEKVTDSPKYESCTCRSLQLRQRQVVFKPPSPPVYKKVPRIFSPYRLIDLLLLSMGFRRFSGGSATASLTIQWDANSTLNSIM
ncbi:unnamed protein product [Albugo candida]|uniref:Uncharacterized protein n=1 Tax=Albugo candida TaxID=65357 RepID=A0A024GMA4_9STRA|nr:unnamed protein product [Albugo candida]|eukprot:CCI48001.1 unnamed protein product [Albugo candida]